MIKVNATKVIAELNLVIQQIKELKYRRAQSGQPNWVWKDMRELSFLKDLATSHCTILAHRHGKLHLKRLENLEAQEVELKELMTRNSVIWSQFFRFEDPVPVALIVEHSA
jgi:hypothetical protein